LSSISGRVGKTLGLLEANFFGFKSRGQRRNCGSHQSPKVSEKWIVTKELIGGAK
jgi:hypothetical protein